MSSDIRPLTPQDQTSELLDDLRRRERHIYQLERKLQEALSGRLPEPIEIRSDVFLLQSLVSARTGEPLVNLRWSDGVAQLPVAQARELALNLLGAAEAALSDACLRRFLLERVGWQEPEEIGQLLVGLRKFRDEFSASQEGGRDADQADG
ncbi:MAG: hypothetical protein U0Z53_23585 [Blastocatellia bacterium]